MAHELILKVDWRDVGAVAGPVLALVALGWQATERLRRPVIEAWFVAEGFGRMEPRPGEPDWGVSLIGTARVINPRPGPVIVERVEMQSKGRGPWRRVTLGEDHSLHQIPPVGEAQFDVWLLDLQRPEQVRMAVSLRGRSRALTSAWSFEGAEEMERARAHKGLWSTSRRLGPD